MAYINAISYHFPKRVISNQEILDDYFRYPTEKTNGNLTAETLEAQCWVKKRYQSAGDETARDLGNAAAEKMFREWNIDKNTIDYIIFVSDALEYKGPTTACLMQNDLGLGKNVAAIDILHGCTGFVYGLSIAEALLKSEQANNILLVTADVPSKVIHPSDAELRAIFSDAGAATLVSKKKINKGINANLGKFVFGTDGSGEHTLKTERSATRDPADVKWLRQFEDVPHGNTGGRLVMNSAKVFLFAMRTVPRLAKAVLEKEGIEEKSIAFYILHQANGQMLDFIRKRMKLPEEKFIINIQEKGNTVSASIPIALYDTYKAGKIKEKDKVLLVGFGIGLSWGGTIINF